MGLESLRLVCRFRAVCLELPRQARRRELVGQVRDESAWDGCSEDWAAAENASLEPGSDTAKPPMAAPEMRTRILRGLPAL